MLAFVSHLISSILDPKFLAHYTTNLKKIIGLQPRHHFRASLLIFSKHHSTSTWSHSFWLFFRYMVSVLIGFSLNISSPTNWSLMTVTSAIYISFFNLRPRRSLWVPWSSSVGLDYSESIEALLNALSIDYCYFFEISLFQSSWAESVDFPV